MLLDFLRKTSVNPLFVPVRQRNVRVLSQTQMANGTKRLSAVVSANFTE